MAQRDVFEMFPQALNKAKDFFDEDKIDEYAHECREFLAPDCPRYHRMKTLILLGCSVVDLADMGECYQEANGLWRIARCYNSEGDAEAEGAMNELRGELDALHARILREAARKETEAFADDQNEEDGGEDGDAGADEEDLVDGEGRQ